jgi:hypothetical protein
MKKDAIIYWSTTMLIFLFEGIMPAFTSQTEMAKEGIRHLGYPEYFGVALTIFKVLGAIILVLPKFPLRMKEWAYAGFGFDFIFAGISLAVVDGMNAMVFFPVFTMIILGISYFYYNKLYVTKPQQ